MNNLKHSILRVFALVLALAAPIVQAPAWAGDVPVVINGGQAKKLPAATALQLNAPTAGSATVNLPHGTAPTSPANGDCWTTTAGLHCRIDGVTVGPYAIAGGVPTITLSGDVAGSGTTAITTAIGANKVLNTMLRQGGALSVIGRSANSTGDVADIAAGSDGHVLRRAGTALGFGTVATAGIADGAVTPAKLANVATATIRGRATAGTGVPEDLTAAQARTLLAVGDYAAATYTPTVTAASGTITTKSATGRWIRTGNMVTVWVEVTITTNGTGAGAVVATLPSGLATAIKAVGSSRELAVTGKTGSATVDSVLNTTVNLTNYDNTYPGANGAVIVATVTYSI